MQHTVVNNRKKAKEKKLKMLKVYITQWGMPTIFLGFSEPWGIEIKGFRQCHSYL